MTPLNGPDSGIGHHGTMYWMKSVGLQLALAVDKFHVRFNYSLSTAIKERS